MKNLENSVRKLKAMGMDAIVGDCGYMHSVQNFVAARTGLPALLSPMPQLTFMISAIGDKGIVSGKPRKVVICVSCPEAMPC